MQEKNEYFLITNKNGGCCTLKLQQSGVFAEKSAAKVLVV